MGKWSSEAALATLESRAHAIWENLHKNNLWKRIIKNTLATTTAVILCLIPQTQAIYGRAAYLMPIATVFGHPGRRLGMMVEALVLAGSGVLLGLAWSILGVYLSSLVYSSDKPAAYTIKGIFLAVVMLIHGFLRSHTPRLFIFVLLMVIVSVVTLTSPSDAVSAISATQIIYPNFTAFGVLLLINVTVFPEFSSWFLGTTTIETLSETMVALRDASVYFTATYDKQSAKTDPVEPNSSDGSLPEDGRNESVSKDQSRESTIIKNFWRDFKEWILARKHGEVDSSEDEAAGKPDEEVKLKDLTSAKAKLRAKLASCKSAQSECNFELAFSCLPPRDLKNISHTQMTKLVANVIALIGACESRFALLGEPEVETKKDAEGNDDVDEGDEERAQSSRDSTPYPSRPSSPAPKGDSDQESTRKSKRKGKGKKHDKRVKIEKTDLELIKPHKEIEFGDDRLFRYLLNRVAKPIVDFQKVLDVSAEVVNTCLAYVYDVPKTPSGQVRLKGIMLEELDIHVESLEQGLSDFDRKASTALERAAVLHELKSEETIDIMPREEMFLIASFLLNLRQAGAHTVEMLKHARVLVERRQARHDRRRLYAPRINWQKWLLSGGDEDQSPGNDGAKAARSNRQAAEKDEDDDDESESQVPLTSKENGKSKTQSGQDLKNNRSKPKKTEASPQASVSWMLAFRIGFADSLDWITNSEDVAYAVKLTCAVFLVTWPAFVAHWNTWYSLNRGLWASLQLVLVTEVAIGTSVTTFLLRAVGTTIGCLWGWAAYEARDGNRFVCAVMIFLGVIPCAYIQLGTKYMKAGMVCIISMSIVALATEIGTVPGTATENFLKRWIAFLIGGFVALLVEVVIFPVRARTKLVESLALAIRQINEMESCVAFGIETKTHVNVYSPEVTKRFESASGKAQGALAAAESFLPFCNNEPRLKGSFKELAMVYSEILFVLHQIVDRMENMLQLRRSYGSIVIEEFNAEVYPYRRNLAASVTLILFAVHEALTTKLPLPQFLPSARLAHLRLINRVRQLALSDPHNNTEAEDVSEVIRRRAVRRHFMAWNAGSAAQIEVIEYLEELIELTKLLVGANEFRSGILMRPTYREYVSKLSAPTADLTDEPENEPVPDLRKRRTWSRSNRDQVDDELPNSLRRIQSRRQDARIARQKTNESLKQQLGGF